MICIFEISSSESLDFNRLIHIDPEQTFEEFHQILQRTCNFDSSQLASFFLTDDFWRKNLEISSLDSGKKALNFASMRTTKINRYITKIGQKLIYVFDYNSDRFLHIKLNEILMKTDLKEPFVAYENGNAPAQFLANEYETAYVDVLEVDDSDKTFGELEDYFEIYGELDL